MQKGEFGTPQKSCRKHHSTAKFQVRHKQKDELKDYDYLTTENMDNLSLEARQKLTAIKPLTLGQASRISGINPSDIAILAMRVK